MTVTPTTQENNIQWLEISDLEIDPSRTYVFAGLGVKIAYRVSVHGSFGMCAHPRVDGTPYVSYKLS